MAPGAAAVPAGPEAGPSFRFLSRWDLQAGLPAVWDALVDFERWPAWWPGLSDVEEEQRGGSDGVGQKATSRWQAPLGYSLEVAIEAVERIEPNRLKGIASGDLEGFGSWDLTAASGWTTVCFRWEVSPTRKWMTALVPVARPLFVRGHDHVMEGGAEGLAGHLGCEIRGFSAESD